MLEPATGPVALGDTVVWLLLRFAAAGLMAVGAPLYQMRCPHQPECTGHLGKRVAVLPWSNLESAPLADYRVAAVGLIPFLSTDGSSFSTRETYVHEPRRLIKRPI